MASRPNKPKIVDEEKKLSFVREETRDLVKTETERRVVESDRKQIETKK